MPNPPLTNYLRTHRRRTCFSQKEIAKLLGATFGTKISRHENFGREPSLKTVLAYEVVFGKPARELFAGAYEEVRLSVQSRAKELARQLAKESSGPQSVRLARKLEALRGIVDAKGLGRRSLES